MCQYSRVEIHTLQTKEELGRESAAAGVPAIKSAIARKGEATIILATGASQFETLKALVATPDIDWSKVTVFHLDEYIGLPITHPASFRKYLQERFVERVPGLKEFVAVEGDAPSPEAEIDRLNARIASRTVDVCFCGIGENGHLAFNDPPADFDAESPYIIVNLDEACRTQQLGEGWFENLDAVPSTAISMTIPWILKSKLLVVSVPDERKANAVRCAVEGPVTPTCPASALQSHENCHLFLDPPAASLLENR